MISNLKEKESAQFQEWLFSSVFLYDYLSIHKAKRFQTLTISKFSKAYHREDEQITRLRKYFYLAGRTPDNRGLLSECQILIPRTKEDHDNAKCQPVFNRLQDLEMNSEITGIEQCVSGKEEGGLLAVSTSSQEISFFNILRMRQGEVMRLGGHQDSVSCMRNGSQGFLSGDQSGMVYLWGLKERENMLTQKMKCHQGRITDLAWLPDNTHGSFISASSDTCIMIWDIRTDKPVQRIQAHSSDVTSLCCLSNNQFISGSKDSNIKLWDLKNSRNFIYRQNQTAVMKLMPLEKPESNSSGKILFASGSYNGNVILWSNKVEFIHCGHESPIRDFDYDYKDNLFISIQAAKTNVMAWRPGVNPQDSESISI